MFQCELWFSYMHFEDSRHIFYKGFLAIPSRITSGGKLLIHNPMWKWLDTQTVGLLHLHPLSPGLSKQGALGKWPLNPPNPRLCRLSFTCDSFSPHGHKWGDLTFYPPMFVLPASAYSGTMPTRELPPTALHTKRPRPVASDGKIRDLTGWCLVLRGNHLSMCKYWMTLAFDPCQVKNRSLGVFMFMGSRQWMVLGCIWFTDY